MLLKQYFGHSGFRSGQEELIDTILSGRDVLGVMPTGAGKSICYQLPALLLPGTTLVISPLISLMKDQVAALAHSGIPAAYMNSSLTPQQSREVYRRAKNGAYKIIYAAPERLANADFLLFAKQTEIPLLAVDEAHCVSQWGQDFRPGYLKIAGFVESLSKRPVVAAFTATATAQVKGDIEKLLLLQNPMRITTGFDRPNLFFEVARPKSKDVYLRSFLAGRPDQSGMIYCATRKAVESVYDNLVQNGVAAARYHAGLEDIERKKNQEDFIYDRARIMVATNAFGMGIDKSNVSFVVHYNMPKNIESYYQEAGRAGRDGEKACCVLLFSPGDIQTAKFLINNATDNETLTEEERELIRRQDFHRLEQMAAYCKTTGCLRAHILRYFGENAPAVCGGCGNCTGETVERDITVEAQKILSAVARVERKYPYGLGLTLIVRMLHGSKEKRVIQLGLDALPTYGSLREIDRAQIREDIDCLVAKGYLYLTNHEYPVLRLTEQANKVLFHGERVVAVCRKKSRAEEAASSQKSAPALPAQPDDSLFAALKALRFKLAQRENAPAFVVFSNATLTDMAVKQPRSIGDFLKVSGIGEYKAAKYGPAFLEEINKWIGKENREQPFHEK